MSAAQEMVPASPFEMEPPVETWVESLRAELEAAEGAAKLAHLDYLLSLMRENREQAAQNEDVATRRMDMIRHWRDEQNASLDRRYGYLESLVLQHAAGHTYPKGKKSVSLPNGKFGRRIVQRAGLKIIDQTAALDFAKSHDIPVKVVESVQITPLKEYAESTGITPAGCEPVPEVESFFVDVK